MKTCGKCGEFNSDTATICEKCGNMLDVKSEASMAASSQKAVKEDDIHLLIREMKNIQQELYQQSEKINTIKNCMIFFVIMDILSIVFLILFSI